MKQVECNCCHQNCTDYIIDKDLGYVCKDCQKLLSVKGEFEEVDDIELSNQYFYCGFCSEYLPMSKLHILPSNSSATFLCDDCLAIMNNKHDDYNTDWVKTHPYEGTKKLYFVIETGKAHIDKDAIAKTGLSFVKDITDDIYQSLVYEGEMTWKELLNIFLNSDEDAVVCADNITAFFEYIPEDPDAGYHFIEVSEADYIERLFKNN